MASKLQSHSLWLLKYVVSKLPCGYCNHLPLPSDSPPAVCMSTMRGLQKSGLVIEQHTGCFYATPKGVERAKEVE